MLHIETMIIEILRPLGASAGGAKRPQDTLLRQLSYCFWQKPTRRRAKARRKGKMAARRGRAEKGYKGKEGATEMARLGPKKCDFMWIPLSFSSESTFRRGLCAQPCWRDHVWGLGLVRLGANGHSEGVPIVLPWT